MEINDKTKVGLFAVIAVIPTFVGFVFWISMIYFKADAAQAANDKQDQKLDAQMVILLDIRDKVTRLETEISKEKK